MQLKVNNKNQNQNIKQEEINKELYLSSKQEPFLSGNIYFDTIFVVIHAIIVFSTIYICWAYGWIWAGCYLFICFITVFSIAIQLDKNDVFRDFMTERSRNTVQKYTDQEIKPVEEYKTLRREFRRRVE